MFVPYEHVRRSSSAPPPTAPNSSASASTNPAPSTPPPGNPDRGRRDYRVMDDATLVGLAREGDEGRSWSWWRGTGRWWSGCAGGCWATWGWLEDAAQEAVLVAMVSLDRLERPERFGAWLGGIGLNVRRRWRRDQAREAWSLAALTGGGAGPDPVPDEPAERAEAAEAARRVRRAVERLPAGQRAAVVLFTWWDGPPGGGGRPRHRGRDGQTRLHKAGPPSARSWRRGGGRTTWRRRRPGR